MKTNYLVTLLLIIAPAYSIFSQEIEAKLSGNTSNQGFSIMDNFNNTLLRVTGQGNVGIGTLYPSRRLEVSGSIGWGTTNAVLQSDQGASIELRGNGIPYIDFSNDPTSDYDIRLMLNLNNILEIDGDVGIGTNNTNGYKLAVAGNIIAEEIVVKLRANWPDYVFDKDYKKPNIEELENYIYKNGHLPNIPDGQKVSNEGINIAEIQVKMLEKIEELTLYIIEQNKRLVKLEQDNEWLREKYLQNNQ